MIPAIQEINFPSYATLHQATASFSEMGERTISTQVRIDGDIVPDFNGWELSFKGERFILNTKDPQAVKDNSTRNSLVDLTFVSWPVNELKRYFFFEPTSIDSGTAIADKYIAPVNLPVEDFAVLFNKVLKYYFGDRIVFSLYMSGQGQYSTDRALVEINYTYIWDVLVKFFEIYGVRWRIEYDSTNDVYTIKAGYPANEIGDHDFEYGYKGGLVRFERQVQDVDIHNILLGRGGEKNLPYRYFKRTDPQNPEWTADPDAIPELANIYFERLRDINFRWYVRGWMQNPNRDTSWEEEGYSYPAYTISQDSPYYFAYEKGRTDEKFNPVEYVRDLTSIENYGERWGALDDNDDIFPTIQSVTRDPLGRIDETVAVSDIVTDDISAMAQNAAVEKSINRMVLSLSDNQETEFEIQSEEFTIPSGSTGNITYAPIGTDELYPGLVRFDTDNSTIVAVSGNNEYPIDAIPAGTYRLKLNMVIARSGQATSATGTFGIENIVLTTSSQETDAWKPTFDIWVKNIWGTEKQAGETDVQYAERVWLPILGDRAGNEAKIVFSTGFMSISEDYEFTIVSYPVYDTSKSINGTPSEWRITLRKSDAEFDATGLYIPNASSGGKPVAGDKFFFIGIDMPFRYVTLAEEDVNTNKSAQLDTEAAISPTWIMNLDKVRVHTLEDDEYGQTLAERMSAGTKVWITDPRFTPGKKLQLYIQSITYTWNEPSDESPYIVPDIEVVLSDQVITTESVVQRIQNDVSSIKNQYARISDVEAVVRSVAEPIFLKKTGESDSSDSPTQFSSKVTSKGFRQGGVGGKGWGIYRDNTSDFAEGEEGEGDTVFEADRIVVRKELQVNSLVINQISYLGGMEIISAAKIDVSKVIETENGYVCYFDQRQNSVSNNFVVNDIAMGQVFNPNNTEQRYYKAIVTAVDLDSITLSKTQKVGNGVPKVGDVIVQYGNTTQSGRQYVIIRDVIGGGYERMLSGLNSLSADGDEYYFAGRESSGTGPRWFVGSHEQNGDYAEYENGVLTIKANVVFKQGQVIPGLSDLTDDVEALEYLKTALPKSDTIITGGLILSKVIALRDSKNAIMSGINGDTSLSNIAAWYGGPMADKEASPTPASYAKSLFRFDGSGYLAGGNIHWDNQGYGGIPGITWSNDGTNDVVTIGANVRLASVEGDTVTDLLEAVNSIKDLFEIVNGNIHVKNNRGFYSDSFISAGGLSDGGGSAGGNATLVAQTYGGTLSATGINPINFYSKEKVDELLLTAGSVRSVAGVSPSNGDIPVANLKSALGLGAAAAYGVGSVASGNTGLVTGGSVYSAINEAVSSVLKMQGTTTTAISDGSTTNPVVIDGSSYTAKKGDVVMYGNKEFWWTGSAWEELGDEASWALKTTTISAGTGLTGGGSLASNRTISLSQATIDSLALADTALQAHQTIYSLTIKNSSGTTQLTYTPNAEAGSITLTKAMVGLGNVENTALSTWVGTNKITTVGTIATGTWQGTAIGYNYVAAHYIGRTRTTASAANATLLGINAISNAASSGSSDKSRIVWDSTNNAWHFLGNVYADGFVSAGGLSSGGGSEGASLAAVWASLKTNSDDYANEKINAYHIPIGSGLSVVNGLIVANNAGTVTSVKVGTTTYNPTDGVVSLPAYPTSLPASDVYSWAKAETKPSYAFSEITGTASTSQIPTLAISKISGLQTALDGKQPLDADLTAIAGLTGTSGFLKKTAANTWALDTLVYERTYTYQIPASAGVRISFEPNASCYITASRTNNGGQLVLIGTGYGAEGTTRNAFTEVVSSSWFDWSLPASSGISTSVEILHKSDSGVAYITVHSSGSITFTAIDALTTPAQNARLWSRNNSGSTDYPWSASWLALNGALSGATTISASGQAEVGSLKLASGTPTLTWDDNAKAWHLSGNFYADGFISAGGVSSGGGSEGVNLTAVWDNLVANTGEGLNKVINVAHIPALASISGNLTVSRISDIETWISGKGYLTSLSFDGLTSHPTTLGGYGITDWVVKLDGNSPDTFTTAGIYRVSNQSGATNFQYGQVLVLRGTSSSNTITQVAFPYNSNNIYFRRGTTSNFTSDAWKTILNSANYTSYVNTTNFPGLNGNQTITLSGDVSGSGATSIAVSIGTGKVTNAMLAGSIENSKLNTIGVAKGGTGLTTWTGAYRIIYSSAATTVTTLAPNSTTTRKFLRQVGANNAATAPAWDTVTKTDVGLSNVENTALSTWAGTNKITTLGTITTGTWNGTAIANSYLANSAITINGSSTSLGGSFSTASITAGTAGQSTASSGVSFSIPYVTMNAYGIVTGYGTHTHTISASELTATIGTTTYAPYNANGYLPLAGGTMTGAITPASGQSSVPWACSTLRLGGYSSRITAAGWYRFYTASSADSLGNSVILHINRGYGSNNNESYTIAVNIAYNGGISVTQLNGYANQQLITKVRVDYTPSGALYVDFYSAAPAGSGNTVYVTCEGKGSVQGPTTVSSPTGTTKEYALIKNGLATSGNIVATGAITAGSASDARLKTNVRTMSADDALRMVMALRPVTFEWNADATRLYDQYKGADLGFIAQEVEPYLPQAIGSIFENYKRLDQTKFIAPLVSVAQDHERRIRQLEAELKKRLNMN